MTGQTEKTLKFWASTTIVAILVGAGAFFSYVHGFIFTRQEGEDLKVRVTKAEDRLENKLDKLGELSGKLDAIILFLGKKDERKH